MTNLKEIQAIVGDVIEKPGKKPYVVAWPLDRKQLDGNSVTFSVDICKGNIPQKKTRIVLEDVFYLEKHGWRTKKIRSAQPAEIKSASNQ